MNPYLLEPLFPEDPGLQKEAEAVVAAGENLGKHLHPATISSIAELLRNVNCYYSNLIEGHNTHPIDIERALHADYSDDPSKRNLQLEAKAHIEIELLIEKEQQLNPNRNLCENDFLCWVHREFYTRLPEEFRWVRNPETGKQEPVVPGTIRTYDAKVGVHIAPPHQDIPDYLNKIAEVYNPARFGKADGMIALSAAHHRILWVHPFGDGNGRVTRLMTDAYLRRLGIGGHGLWSISRGLARKRNEYKTALATADGERLDNYDGRGARSLRALVEFCRFFLDVSLDQMRYMADLLEVDSLAKRLENYVRSRYRPEASQLLLDLLYKGTIPRAEIPRILGLPGRTARRVVKELTDEGFIRSATHRAPIRLRIPANAALHLFPELYTTSV